MLHPSSPPNILDAARNRLYTPHVFVGDVCVSPRVEYADLIIAHATTLACKRKISLEKVQAGAPREYGRWVESCALTEDAREKYDARGDRPLHAASKDPFQFEKLVFLLHSGAWIDALNIQGETPLRCAVLSSNYLAVSHLLDCGADMVTPGLDGRSATKVAAQSGDLKLFNLFKEHAEAETRRIAQNEAVGIL